MVIIGHSASADSFLKYFIYSFHMSLFFIISAILIKTKGNIALCDAIRKEKKIAIDYCLYSILYIVFDIVIRILITKELYPKAVIGDIYQIITLSGISVLWFLSTLFLCKVAIRVIIPKLKNKVSIFLAGVGCYMIGYLLSEIITRQEHGMIMLIFYPALTITRIFFVMGIMLIAIAIKDTFFMIIQTDVQAKALFIGVASLCCLMIVCILEKNNGVEIVDFKFAYVGNAFLTLVLSFIGTYSVLGISCWLVRSKRICQVTVFLGKNSLFIMATHEYLKIKEVIAGGIILIFPEIAQHDCLRKTIIVIFLMVIEVVLIKFIYPWYERIESRLISKFR